MSIPLHAYQTLERLESVLLLTPEKLPMSDRRTIVRCIDNTEYSLPLTPAECERLDDIYHRLP